MTKTQFICVFLLLSAILLNTSHTDMIIEAKILSFLGSTIGVISGLFAVWQKDKK